ncbi:hypothetical protein [Rhodococcus pyridinivorans]|nr:hypothetical protein [Rhodococcus pyridinivorans]WAL47227.1 hypothetical protein OQN32_03760 [Rhodococcus pyridinivorans]
MTGAVDPATRTVRTREHGPQALPAVSYSYLLAFSLFTAAIAVADGRTRS